MPYIQETEAHKLVGRISLRGEGADIIFTKGRSISGIDAAELLVELENQLSQYNDGRLPDYFEIDATPIVSKAFVESIKNSLNAACQIFPVSLKFQDLMISDYFVINVLNKVSCINVKASECSMYKTRIMRLHRLKLMEGYEPPLPIYRAKEFPLAIMVEKLIVSKLRCSGLTGFQLTRAEGWGDSHRF